MTRADQRRANRAADKGNDQMQDVKTMSRLRVLVEAINHYISTADGSAVDSFGSAVMGWKGENWLITIPVDFSDPTDESDFCRLTARLEQIKESGQLPFSFEEDGYAKTVQNRYPVYKNYGVYTLTLHVSNLMRLAQALVSQPAPGGFGSMYTDIQRHFPGTRERILLYKD